MNQWKKRQRLALIPFVLGHLINAVFATSTGFTAYDDVSADFQKVLVDTSSGTVYVGGKNALHAFDSDLRPLAHISTGPVNDSLDCDPASPELCLNTSEQANNAKIMLENPQRPDEFLYCGSAKQGLCATVSKTNFTHLKYLDAGNKYNFLGSKKTVSAFFGKQVPAIPLPNVNPLYVAQEYDGRPLNLTPETISSRYVRQDQDSNANIEISLMTNHPGGDVKTAKDIRQSIKPTYEVRNIYSFEYGRFSFFLTVAREQINWGWYTTRLARVCQEDSGYYSYAEIELHCSHKMWVGGSHPIIFKIAEDAHFGKVGAKFADRYNLPEDEQVLYILFGMGEEYTGVVNKTYGSGVCIYSITDILLEYQRGLTDCYRGVGKLLPWYYPDTRCTKDYSALDNITRDVNWCYDARSVHNDAVGRTGFTLQTSTNITLDHHATALNIVVQDDWTVALMGTDKGTIVKQRIDGSHSPLYAEIDITEGLDGEFPIAKDMALDASHRYLYAMAGPRLVKVNLATCAIYKDVLCKLAKVDLETCAIYKDCASCVSAARKDPLNCGWCDGHCARETDCASGEWQSTSCPPLLYSFEPKAGPVQGGTRITIEGEYFGSFEHARTKRVTVAYEQCDIVDDSFNSSLIVCVTQPSEVIMDNRVTVEIVDNSKETESFQIRGKADSSPVHFYYKEAGVFDVTPRIGPRSGGTPVTIRGRHLEIGTDLKVSVVDLPCSVISARSDSEQIVCVTSPLPTVSSQKRSLLQTEAASENGSLAAGGVLVQIDSALMEVPDALFVYEEDPAVFDVYPRRSIASGGIGITVSGENLHVVHDPRLVLKDPGLNYTYPPQDCNANGEGTLLVCITPPFYTANGTAYSGTRVEDPVSLDIHFSMDGVAELIDFPSSHPHMRSMQYYVDPVLYPLGTASTGNHINFYTHQTYLEILGEHLTLGASTQDYTVFIGQDLCHVTELRKNLLRCRPNLPEPLAEIEPNRLVTVVVGADALAYDLGTVRYTERHLELVAAVIAIPIAVTAMLVGLLLCICLMRKHRKGPFKQKQSELTVVYRADGSYDGIEDAVSNTYMRRSQLGPGEAVSEAEPLIGHEYLQILDSTIVIERQRLKLLDVVGQGNFGCVYKGLLQHGENKEEIPVAVKTLKTLSESRYANVVNAQEARAFLEEALRMREFNHPNILCLSGICFDDVTEEHGQGQGQPMVVTPYMQHGDLLHYIRDDNNTPTIKVLMQCGIDIAEGMAYLAKLKFVHRDLAARNCMLDDKLNVKVADFGLSRDVYEKDYYSSDGRRAKLPVKWMAIESLEKGIYNSKTDVWAFGIVLWELMTRGVTPYPEVGNWEIIKYLKPGRRMPQPAYCPDRVYDVMLDCWNPEGSQRPPFHLLSASLRQIIQDMEQSAELEHEQAARIYTNVPTSQEYLYPTSQSTYERTSRASPHTESSQSPPRLISRGMSRDEGSLSQHPSTSRGHIHHGREGQIANHGENKTRVSTRALSRGGGNVQTPLMAVRGESQSASDRDQEATPRSRLTSRDNEISEETMLAMPHEDRSDERLILTPSSVSRDHSYEQTVRLPHNSGSYDGRSMML